MKFLFTFLIVLIITAAATLVAINEPGYVLLGVGRKALQMPLMDFILIVSALFILFYILLNAFLSMKKAPHALKKSYLSGRRKRARKGMTSGLLEMAEGNWSKAEKLLTASAAKGESPLLNYLAAAQSAEQQNNMPARDEYLAKAAQVDPAANVVIGLTQAELLNNKGQEEEELATLQSLYDQHPEHPQVQKQLIRSLVHHHQWQQIIDLLPRLKKNKSMTDEEKDSVESVAWAALLRQAGDDRDRSALEGIWKKLSKKIKNQPEVLSSYCRQLIKLKDSPSAEPLLRKAINNKWSDELVAIYGQLELDNPASAIKQTEGWLKDHPDSPELLAAAGQLNSAARVWGKARNYLQESLELKPVAPTYRAMAALMDSLGEGEAAKQYYKKGLELFSSEGV